LITLMENALAAPVVAAEGSGYSTDKNGHFLLTSHWTEIGTCPYPEISE
jgi:hypothetical protein